VIEATVADTGDNSLATVILRFSLDEELTDSGAVDVSVEQLEVTDFCHLERLDRTINTVIVDRLKAAFDWDGRDLAFWADVENLSRVVVKLEPHVYKGKHSIRVKYIDPVGGGSGRGPKVSGDAASVAARIGSKLRALNSAPVAAGGKSAPAPVKAPPAPAPAKPAAPRVPQRGRAELPDTAETVWAMIVEACGGDRNKANALWLEVLTELGIDRDNATAEQWRQVKAKVAAQAIPI
jgi:hypothetical protein